MRLDTYILITGRKPRRPRRWRGAAAAAGAKGREMQATARMKGGKKKKRKGTRTPREMSF
jgi:hypothetical protein